MGTHTPGVAVSGGTLGGKGTILGSVSVLSGTLSPGLGPDDVASIQGFTLTPGNVLNTAAVKMGPSASYASRYPRQHRLRAAQRQRAGRRGREHCC